ncbi:GIY-YIG nuclease family protein [Longicatena caecimuris]|uniref:GIY-YIG nuclease family protein n=1 Tax=Longicatena caecimuris TaxID=1796635 RepID=UPI0022E682BF|nr:GIY-YIG nuclease family protein [Longicatena caecimuris]
MGNGVIYILTNPSFPQYVKIGYASDLQRRLRELNRSEALPFAFRAYAVYEVTHKLTDRALHELLDQLNPDLRTIETFDGKTRIREFFEMSAEDAYAILEAVARISGTEHRLHRVTPTGDQLTDEAKAEEVRRASTGRRSRFKFSMIGLKAGDEVAFRDDATKRARVVDDTHIEYDGVTTSLSRLANELTGIEHSLQGTIYFTYQGELLDDIRQRMDGGGDSFGEKEIKAQRQ